MNIEVERIGKIGNMPYDTIHNFFVISLNYDDTLTVVLGKNWSGQRDSHFQYYLCEYDVDFKKLRAKKNQIDFDFSSVIGIYYIEKVESNYLIANPRCWYEGNGHISTNVHLIDTNGYVINKPVYGDGISDIKYIGSERIVVSYFDEGIFGNYGFGDLGDSIPPIGRHGLQVFNINGDKIKSTDIESLHLDDVGDIGINNNKFFIFLGKQAIYFSNDGDIVERREFESYILGVVLHNNDLTKFVYKKWNKEGYFYKELNTISNEEKVYFTYKENVIQVKEFACRDTKFVIVDENDYIYIGNII